MSERLVYLIENIIVPVYAAQTKKEEALDRVEQFFKYERQEFKGLLNPLHFYYG